MIKAASHIHSEWSYDGKWPLRKLAAEFGRRGYRILLMTEHDRGFTAERFAQYRQACVEAGSDEVQVVPGIEYSDASNTIHVLVWGLKEFLGEALPTSELLRRVSDCGGVAVLAHPSRKAAWKLYDSAWTSGLVGIEIWNRKTDGWAPSLAAVSLIDRTGLQPFVGMDFHTPRQFFPMATELGERPPVVEASLIACLKEKNCRGTVFGRPVAGFMRQSWRQSGLRVAELGRRVAARASRSLKRSGMSWLD